MAVIVEIPRALQPYANGAQLVELEAPGRTVGDALTALEARSPGVIDRVMTEQRIVRQHVNVFLDDENIRFLAGLDTPLREGSTITILAAVSGG